jgi:hypothetical protein
MPLPETFGNPLQNDSLTEAVVSVRPERGSLVANYDASSVKKPKVLRCQFRTLYDGNLVRNTYDQRVKACLFGQDLQPEHERLASVLAMPIWPEVRSERGR